MNITIKNTMVWIITIVLMSIDICIVFMDPLERQYDLTQVVIAWYLVDPLNKQLPTKMIAIWFIVLVILDYPLRHNKIYKEIRILVYIIFLALLYWLFPT